MRRESPLPPPQELEAYGHVVSDLPNRIVVMAEQNQAARIRALEVPVRAESASLTIATVAVSFFPWVGVVAAVVLAVLGQDAAAVIAAIATCAAASPQVISATRGARRR